MADMPPAEELAYLKAKGLPCGRGFQQAQARRIAYLQSVVFGWQTVKRDTLMGVRDCFAPGGWAFTKTDIIVWAQLLHYTKERRGKLKTQRAGHVLDGQIEALTQVLANALGMAPYYWWEQARLMVEELA